MFRLGLRSVLAAAVVGLLVTQVQAATSFTSRTIVEQLSSDGPQVLHLADVNDDGLDDLLAVDRDRDRLLVFLNQGDGNFGSPAVARTAGGPLAVASGDFNGDGDLDVVTVNSIAGNVSVFLGDGSGTFSEAGRRDSAVGAAVLGVAVADFDEDDFDDLAVLSGDNVYLMRSTENGSFARFSPASFRTRSSNNTSFAVVTADFNDDGSPDLAISNRSDGQIAVFLATGPGTFAFSQGGFVNVGGEVTGVVAADFDGDGGDDLVGVDVSGDLTLELKVFFNPDRDGSFPSRETATSAENPFAITILDVDNDGRLDLAVTTRDNGPISLLCQPSDVCNLVIQGLPLEAGIWRPIGFETGLGMGQGQVSITSGRLNDDEFDDLVALGNDLRTIGVFLNTSTAGTPVPTVPGASPTPTGPTATPTMTPTPMPTATPTPIPTVPLGACEITLLASLPTAVDPVAFAVSDFDFDGQRDIAVADRAGGRVIVYYGSPAGGGATNSCARYSLARGQTVSGLASPVDLAVADFDRDSRPDLVVVAADGITPLFGPGTRGGEFVRGPTLGAGTNPARLSVADFNRDGVPDVVVTDAGGTRVHFFFGAAGRDNPFGGTACPFNVSKTSDRVVAADLNRDARPDLVLTSPQTNDISVFVRNVDRALSCAALASGGSANPFTAIAPIFPGGVPRGLRVGTFDVDDAVPDLVVAARPATVAAQLRLYFGQALGTGVRYPTNTLLGDGGNPLGGPVDIAIGDLNRDARLDLVVLDTDRTDNVVVYLGGVDGRLSLPLLPESTLDAGAPASRGAQALAVTDVDGDSRDDIIVGHSDGLLTLFLSSDPPPTPTPPNTATPTPVLSPTPTFSPIPTATFTPTESPRPTPTFTPRSTSTPRGVVFLSGEGCAAAPTSDRRSGATWPLAGVVALLAARRRRR